ncbi:hypothetical protein L9F63_000599, partial [Diploptera punctata]
LYHIFLFHYLSWVWYSIFFSYEISVYQLSCLLFHTCLLMETKNRENYFKYSSMFLITMSPLLLLAIFNSY